MIDAPRREIVRPSLPEVMRFAPPFGRGLPFWHPIKNTSGVSAPDTPDSIFGSTNLVMWLRGDSLVDDGGGKASAWTDKSSHGNTPVQATSGNRPTINASALGRKAGATFGSGNKLSVTTGGISLTTFSVFAVFKDDGNVFRCYLGFDTFHPEIGSTSGHPGFYSSGSQFPNTVTSTPNTYYLMELTRPTTGIAHIYLNGVENTPAPTDGGLPSSGTVVTVGSGSPASGDPFVGELAELILVDRDATAPESASVRSYINTYYGTSF